MTDSSRADAWLATAVADHDPAGPRLLLTPGETAYQLCERGLWLRICAEALLGDPHHLLRTDGVDRLGPVPAAGGKAELLLETAKDRSPLHGHLAAAVWHAARAERDPEQTEDMLAAALHCAAAREPRTDLNGTDSPSACRGAMSSDELMARHPGLPWGTVAELQRLLKYRSAHEKPLPLSAPVLTRAAQSPDGYRIRHLQLTIVPDPDERTLPDLEAMLFVRGDDPLGGAISAAFDWARAQGNSRPGHGVRYALCEPSGHPIAEYPEVIGAGLAAGATLHRLLRPRRGLTPSRRSTLPRADRRVLLMGALTPEGRTQPLGPSAVSAIRYAKEHRHPVVAHPQDCRDSLTTFPGRRRWLRPARTVREAVRRSHPAPRRLLALTLALLLLLPLGLWLGGAMSQGDSEQQRLHTEAALLARQAVDQAAGPPRTSMLDALASQALAPTAQNTHDALVAAVDHDWRITRTVAGALTRSGLLALDRGADLLATATNSGPLRVWDLAHSRTPLVPRPFGRVRDLAFPRQGTTLAVATPAGSYLWDPESSEPPKRLDAAASDKLAYTPDGHFLAVAHSDGTVSIHALQPPTGSPVDLRNATPVSSLAFTADGSALGIGTTSGQVTVWTWHAGAAHIVRQQQTAAVQAITFATPCSCFYVSAGRQLLSVAPATGRTRPEMTIPFGTRCYYLPETEEIAQASVNAAVVYTASGGTVQGPPNDAFGFGDRLDDTLAVTDDGYVATPSSDGAVVIYHITEQTSPLTILPEMKYVFPVAGTSQLLYVAAGGYAGVFDERHPRITGRPVGLGTLAPYQAVGYSPRNALLAAATGTGVRLFRLSDGTLLDVPGLTAPPTGQVARSVSFDEVHDQLVTGWSHQIAVYNLLPRSATALAYRLDLPRTEEVTALTADPRGKWLFAATTGGAYVLPRKANGFSWTDRTRLSSGFFTHMLPDSGRHSGASSVLTVRDNGSMSVFRLRPDGTSWAELPLTGSGSFTATEGYFGNLAVSSDINSLAVFDTSSGAKILDTYTRPLYTAGMYFDGSRLIIFGDVAADGITLPLSQEALARRACTVLGLGRGNTLSDVWPQAPADVRTRPLCPR